LGRLNWASSETALKQSEAAREKSLLLANTFSCATRSGNLRAISTAPTIVEKITKEGSFFVGSST
jgi:hypothetical protein